LTEPAALVRHNGSMGQLYIALRDELAASGPGTWVRRLLRRGSVVSLYRRQTDGRRILLLSRPVAPATEAEAKVWNGEVGWCLDWFGARFWEPVFTLPAGALDGLDAAVWSAFVEPSSLVKRGLRP
jgi:hypothetical protein